MQQLEEQDIVHFTLAELLPDGQRLAINLEKGTINLMTVQDDLPRLLLEEELTATELPLLLVLLHTYPSWCPYHMAYAMHFYSSTKDKHLARALRVLNEAHDAGNGVYDKEMRPIRGVMSRLRLKLRTFGLEIVSVQLMGYNLMRAEELHYGTSNTKDRLL